jgi:[ribosomal protein S18]-alanine N-acetyltransferase
MTANIPAPARQSEPAVVRLLRAGDVLGVLALCREAFPTDPWTTDTAGGWLARSALGRNQRSARLLERCLSVLRVSEALHLLRLVRYLAQHRRGSEYRIVAEAGEKIAGFGCLETGSGAGHVQAMAVRQACQHQGVGKALLDDLVAEALARGCDAVNLHVRADNPVARRLYRRAGFTDLETCRGFYQPSGTDAVVMRLQTGVAATIRNH